MSRAISSTSTFPPDWPRRELSDLGEIRGGTTPNRTVPSYWDGNIPWVTPGELTGLASKYVFETRDKITQAGLNSASLSLLPRDSLLVTTRATLGSVALAGLPMTTNQGFRSVIFNRGADPHFFYHLFPKLQRELVRRASGTTFLEISGREFGKIQVPLPPVPEQRRIAAILDTIDDAIRKTEQVIAKLERLKRGLLHDLLTRGIDENGELRDPERNPEQFKDSPLGRIPKGWMVKSIGSVGSVTTGTTPPTALHELWGNELPFITPAEITDCGNLLPPVRLLSWQGRAFVREIPPHSLLVVCIGSTIGKATITNDVCATNQQVNAVVPRPGNNPKFLKAAFETQRNAFLALAGLQAVPIVNRSRFQKLLIPVAPQDEQEEIARILQACARRIRKEQRWVAKLRTLKQGLMDDLLTGRVRVPIKEEVAM